MNENNLGFSLLELMITLCLIAILTAFAIPSFRHPILKAEQASAKFALYELAESMEHYFSAYHTYKGVSLQDLSMKVGNSYQLSIVKAEQNSYLIAAKPTQAESQCGDFMLDELGNQSITGTGPIEDCW